MQVFTGNYSLSVVCFCLSLERWGQNEWKIEPNNGLFWRAKKIDGDNLPLVDCFDLLIIGAFLTTSIHLTDLSDKGV